MGNNHDGTDLAYRVLTGRQHREPADPYRPTITPIEHNPIDWSRHVTGFTVYAAVVAAVVPLLFT